jgi:hypothetical protein
MTFNSKTWIDRVTQYPNRRLLTATGTANTYDVTRAEGTVMATGDIINAANLNGLENRTSAAFGLISGEIIGCTATPTIADTQITQIVYTNGGSVVRTDTFAYGTNTITEVRTLATGEIMTLIHHTDTLITEVS